MPRLPVLTIAAAAVGLLLGAYVALRSGVTDVAVAQSTAEASPRPDFTLPDPSGKMRSVDEWNGALIVLNFWATWCPPCLHEIPMFVALQDQYAGRGVQFVGVAIDDAELVREFIGEHTLNYPTMHGQAEAIELMRAYGNDLGALPYTVLIDRAGNVVHRKPGAFTREELETLLATYVDPE